MAWLIRMTGLRVLRRDDGLSDLPADVLGDGMSELTLEYQLKQLNERHMEYSDGLHAKIEQLERELAEQVNKKVGYYNDWIAEKALADRLYDADGYQEIIAAQDAYRKARGME